MDYLVVFIYSTGSDERIQVPVTRFFDTALGIALDDEGDGTTTRVIAAEPLGE